MATQYWHIQLHSDKKLSDTVLQKIVLNKKVIGMAKSWTNKKGQEANDPELFKKMMQRGDVVLVRNGKRPLYLTRVISEAYLSKTVNPGADWFTLRRNIEVLGVFDAQVATLLNQVLKQYNKSQIQALGTLTLCKTNTATVAFINRWYQSLVKVKA